MCAFLTRSEHGNSLHFIPHAVHFLYNNFPKKSIFATQTSPQKAIFWEKFKKIAPQNPGWAPPPPPPGRARRADPPTLADPAIPNAFIRVLPLLGKQWKILVYALIRSVASIRQLPLFGQLVKKKWVQKCPKNGQKRGSIFEEPPLRGRYT